MCLVILAERELHRDPKEKQPATDPKERYRQKMSDDDGEEDAKPNCRTGPEKDPGAPLRRGKGSAGHGDDDRIVAGKEQVDPDDLQHRDEKVASRGNPSALSIRSEGQGVGTSGPPLESGEHAVSKGTRHIVPKPVQCKLQSRLRV